MHVGLNGRQGACEVGCDLRSEVEEPTIELDKRHQSQMLRKGPQGPLSLEIRRKTALSNKNFPQTLKGMEALIQIPDIGRISKDQTLY